MNSFDLAPSYLQNRVQPDAPGASWPDSRDWFVQYQMGLREAAGDVVVNTHTALTYSVVWRCVNYIASTIASLCWHVYQESEDGRTKLPIHDNIAWTLEMQANPEMSAFDWRQVMVIDALLGGDGVAEIERNGAGKPLWLWRIDPRRVSLERNKAGRLYYRVTAPNGGSDDAFLDPMNVYHLKGPGPDGLVGYSPIAVARRAIELGLQQEQYGVGYFRRGPSPGGFLKAPGMMKEEERRAMGQSFSQRYGGARNAGNIAVLSGGMEFTPFSISNEDAQFLEGRNFQAEEICRLYGCPPHKAGVMTHSTFGNIEHQSIEAVQDCLLPWCRRLETEADVKLFGRVQTGRRRTRLDLRTLLRGDSATQTTTLTSQVNGGLRTVNEGRSELDLNPIEGGDTPLVQGAMVPLLQVTDPPEPEPAPAAPGAMPMPAAEDDEPDELLDVPQLLQSRNYDCGAACTQIVAEYFGVDNGRTEDDYIAELGTTAADGTTPEAIVDVLNDAGLVTTSGNGMTLDDLRCCFERGHPVIVPMQEAPAPEGGTAAGHWVVVIGCGLGQVFLQDPVAGRIMLPEDEFDSRWHDLEADGIVSEHFGIVVADAFGYDAEEAEPEAAPAPAPGYDAAARARRRLRNYSPDQERDESGRFGEGGGGSDGGDAAPDEEEAAAQDARDMADAEEQSRHDDEDASIQKGRDKEDASIIKDRDRQDASIQKGRDREDAKVEKEAEKLEKAREKEDNKLGAAEDKLNERRGDEDADTEAEREQEDEARTAEDEEIQGRREAEDNARGEYRESVEQPLQDAYDNTAEGSPEEAEARAELDAVVAQHEKEDAANEAVREKEDAKLQAQRDKEDAARKQEDEARAEKRGDEDAAIEEAAEALQAQRDEEDQDFQDARDAEDEALQAKRDAEDAAREKLRNPTAPANRAALSAAFAPLLTEIYFRQ